ncbi:hypothetical protein [Actinoplanes couchii]|uniref:Uncharacterized protein n=1 Tax=Actinoplanes couchii TaxID=403638 RepID=A0ABQ3XQI8_9ACTN|nr:hypothetical protein [Actinoplanes couchii]MDR6322993.1 hypothetical protein [Actinoplanes couchii]GID60667.1 hypothetical protein Aco03nite_090710 [Actinoplanes couchii]
MKRETKLHAGRPSEGKVEVVGNGVQLILAQLETLIGRENPN